MDKIFMLLLLIAIIAGFYWFQNKIEAGDENKQNIKGAKKYKKIVESESSEILETDDDQPSDDISIGSISMGSLSFDSSVSGGESLSGSISSDILSDDDDDDD